MGLLVPSCRGHDASESAGRFLTRHFRASPLPRYAAHARDRWQGRQPPGSVPVRLPKTRQQPPTRAVEDNGMIATSNGLVDYSDDDLAIMDDAAAELARGAPARAALRAVDGRTPALIKTRSLSDGGSTPSKLTPSPRFVVSPRRTSKDDSNLGDVPAPATPRSSGLKPLSLHMPCCQLTPPSVASTSYVRPPPLSPNLDHAQIYALPTNILPRRSRGLDFSRAATSLHHSTLAEQSSPDSSPTMADRAVNIPGLRGQYGGPEQTSTSLWSMMGSHDKVNVSGSLGSAHAVGSDSSSSDDDHLMDEDTDEPYPMTPQAKSASLVNQRTLGGPLGSPAMSSLTSFQQRQRPRKHLHKKVRGPFGLGFNLSAASLSKSPPSGAARARRGSISWQANQLHISGMETEDGARSQSDADAGSGEGQRKVIRRAVTHRGSLLPKTKTFARIRAALAEEGAPADAETRREAEVVKQVRESDMGLELHAAASTLSSPNLTTQESADDMAEDDIMGDLASGMSSSFKQHAMRNSKGKPFWDAFSESSSWGGAHITPPPTALLPRGSSSGMSEDTAMDSPSLAGLPGHLVWPRCPDSATPTGRKGARRAADRCKQGSQSGSASGPSAAELTRHIHSKRRRDDDLDPLSFKRRAVSPGMSVHNSPILQSPMQRDSGFWGSRPGSTGADKAGSNAPSETGSLGGTPSGAVLGSTAPGRFNTKGRVGFQGMVDTNDGIMRMSIE